MPQVTIRRRVHAPAEQVWSLVTDVSAYERWIPLTSLTHDPGPLRPGWSFTGVTGVGRLSFADRMVVEVAHPPVGRQAGVFAVRKTGRVLGGWARIEVAADTYPVRHGHGSADHAGQRAAGDVCLLTWAEEITLRPEVLGRRLSWAVNPLTTLVFASVVDRIVAEAEGRQR